MKCPRTRPSAPSPSCQATLAPPHGCTSTARPANPDPDPNPNPNPNPKPNPNPNPDQARPASWRGYSTKATGPTGCTRRPLTRPSPPTSSPPRASASTCCASTPRSQPARCLPPLYHPVTPALCRPVATSLPPDCHALTTLHPLLLLTGRARPLVLPRRPTRHAGVARHALAPRAHMQVCSRW